MWLFTELVVNSKVEGTGAMFICLYMPPSGSVRRVGKVRSSDNMLADHQVAAKIVSLSKIDKISWVQSHG